MESFEKSTKILIYSSLKFPPPFPLLCLWVSYWYCLFFCKYLTEYNTLNNIRKLTLIQHFYLIWRHYSGFGNYPNNTIHIKRKSWIMYRIKLSCL